MADEYLQHPTPPEAEKLRVIQQSPILYEVIYAGAVSGETLVRTRMEIDEQMRETYGSRISSGLVADKITSRKQHVGNLFTILGFVNEDQVKNDIEVWRTNDTVWEMLVLLGYEIGNANDILLFLPDVTALLVNDADRDNNFFSDEGRKMLQELGSKHPLLEKATFNSLKVGLSLYENIGRAGEARPSFFLRRAPGLSLYTAGLRDVELNPDSKVTQIPEGIESGIEDIDFKGLLPNDKYRERPSQ